jgi:mono/diheme cytochrome c family protein
MLRLLLVLLLVIVSGSPRAAPGDAAAGLSTAQRWCSQCHVVSRSQSKASDTAPSFRMIAQDPRWLDEKRLVEHLARPHPVMPNFSMTRAEVVDLMAYIATQR